METILDTKNGEGVNCFLRAGRGGKTLHLYEVHAYHWIRTPVKTPNTISANQAIPRYDATTLTKKQTPEATCVVANNTKGVSSIFFFYGWQPLENYTES